MEKSIKKKGRDAAGDDMTRAAPAFSLYGETPASHDDDFVHIEEIAARSQRYDWEIGRHVHHGLCQILMLSAGEVAYRLDEDAGSSEGPCALVVPPATVHAFRFTPGAVGQEMLAGRVSLVADSSSGPEVLGQGLVRAIWTDDEALSTRINKHVAHYTGQAELAQVIQEGLEARKQGDEDTATAKLGRAVALAQQSGNKDTARLLAEVVEVVDAATGTVRLKKRVEDADEMALDTRSTKTVRTRK